MRALALLPLALACASAPPPPVTYAPPASDPPAACAGLLERYARAPALYGDPVAHHVRWARRLLECGHASAVFERTAHVGKLGADGIGAQVLRALEAQGLPMEQHFLRYVEEKSGAAFLPVEHGAYAMDHIAHWLRSRPRPDPCPRLLRALRGARRPVAEAAEPHLQAAGCLAASQEN